MVMEVATVKRWRVNKGSMVCTTLEAESKDSKFFFAELLMEEFRIAHQRMFGGKENNGTMLGKIKSLKQSTVAKEEGDEKEKESNEAVGSKPKDVQTVPNGTTVLTKVITSSQTQQLTKTQAPMPPSSKLPKESPRVPARATKVQESTISTASATNRITIKVLSPKIAS